MSTKFQVDISKNGWVCSILNVKNYFLAIFMGISGFPYLKKYPIQAVQEVF